MMNNISLDKNLIIAVGTSRYRILGNLNGNIIVIEMDTNIRNIFSLGPVDWILQNLVDGKFKLEKDEDYPPVDDQNLSEAVRRTYHRNLEIIGVINGVYSGSCYPGLATVKRKPVLTEILHKYSISKNTLSDLIRNYLQSGCSPYSLIDKRSEGNKTKKISWFNDKRRIEHETVYHRNNN